MLNMIFHNQSAIHYRKLLIIMNGMFLQKYRLILALLMTFFFSKALSQEVQINRIELDGGDVIVSYELLDENPDRRYSLHLYSSQDNFIQPLEFVEGDIGIDIDVGGNKKVTWHASEELGADFTGDMSLELQGNIYVPFIELESFEAYGTIKRGKPYDFTWAGGRGDNVLNFELYQEDKRVKVFEERANVGNTALIIPNDVKPGKNYRFRISDVRNMDEVVYSGTFNVKRKVPLVFKLGTAFAAGVVVGVLNPFSSGEDPIPEPPRPER